MFVDGPVIVLTPSLAMVLDRALDLFEREAVRDRYRLSPAVVATIAQVHGHARALREQSATRLATAGSGSPGSAAESESPIVETMTSTEVAGLLGCGDRNVRDLAARGALPSRKVAGRRVFAVVDVEELARRRQETA